MTVAPESKEHIAATEPIEGWVITLCTKRVPFGQWKAGAAYQGLMLLGVTANNFCPDCQRVWVKEHAR